MLVSKTISLDQHQSPSLSFVFVSEESWCWNHPDQTRKKDNSVFSTFAKSSKTIVTLASLTSRLQNRARIPSKLAIQVGTQVSRYISKTLRSVSREK